MAKRYFFNNKDYFIDKEKGVLTLSKELHQNLLNNQQKIGITNKGFKKIGGSSIGDVLEVDQFKSQFKAFVNLFYMSMPILDDKYINAGIHVEPLLIKYLENRLNIEIETFDPKDYDYDYFKDLDPIIGGIPDGYIANANIILEIKTSGIKNLDNWQKYGVPKGYLKQAQLYAYLKNAARYSIVACFLNDEDYTNLENFDIQSAKKHRWTYDLYKEEAEDDIQKIKDWYIKHTQSGISPQFDLKKDAELLEYLECETPEESEAFLNKKRHELGLE